VPQVFAEFFQSEITLVCRFKYLSLPVLSSSAPVVIDLIKESEKFLKSDIEKFRSLNYQALALARTSGERELEADVLRNISIGERYQQNFDLARSYAMQARRLVASTGDAGAEVEILCGLGRIEFDANDRDAARRYYTEAMELVERSGQTRGKVMALISLGGMALDDHDLRTAKKYFCAAREIYEREGNEEGLAGLQINFSLIWMEYDDQDRAIVEAVSALRTFEKLDQPRNIIFAELNLGRLMAKLKNVNASREYFQSALKRATERHYQTLVVEIERELLALAEIFPAVASL
jgi:tetratricopeptide (TPR) repeat protein